VAYVDSLLNFTVHYSAVILNFFEKMEKSNADMDAECKFNTFLEKVFFRF
jgi:hypothetical protein